MGQCPWPDGSIKFEIFPFHPLIYSYQYIHRTICFINKTQNMLCTCIKSFPWHHKVLITKHSSFELSQTWGQTAPNFFFMVHFSCTSKIVLLIQQRGINTLNINSINIVCWIQELNLCLVIWLHFLKV